jgi:hypothetical protein
MLGYFLSLPVEKIHDFKICQNQMPTVLTVSCHFYYMMFSEVMALDLL